MKLIKVLVTYFMFLRAKTMKSFKYKRATSFYKINLIKKRHQISTLYLSYPWLISNEQSNHFLFPNFKGFTNTTQLFRIMLFKISAVEHQFRCQVVIDPNKCVINHCI